MEFIDKDLLAYCEAHSAAEPELLARLNRETHLRVSSPRMLSGHLQGRFLSMISRLLQPKLILEIGTYTGYSALCLAEGLAADGKLVTIDPNEETNHFAKKYFEESAYSRQIVLMQGQASQIIPTLDGPFDLVFIDADKKSYSTYLDLCADKVRHGGMVIADNVLWSGKVITDAADNETKALKQFNDKASADPRFSALMLPVRDGLQLLSKL